jgi:hypothetical protein
MRLPLYQSPHKQATLPEKPLILFLKILCCRLE